MQVFDAVVGGVAVDVVNDVTFRNFAVPILPNVAVKKITFPIMTAFVFVVNFAEKLLVFVVNDGDAWQFADSFGDRGDGVEFKPKFAFGFQCVEKFSDAFRIFHCVTPFLMSLKITRSSSCPTWAKET